MSGYLHFDKTGNSFIDAISDEIENAGDAYHHTSDWCEASWREDKKSYLEAIQDALNKAAKELAAKDAEIEGLRKDAERWKEVVCRIRTGAIHNGQKVNDKLINGHRDRNRILFSLIGEADPYDPGDKDGFQKVIDAAIAAKQ